MRNKSKYDTIIHKNNVLEANIYRYDKTYFKFCKPSIIMVAKYQSDTPSSQLNRFILCLYVYAGTYKIKSSCILWWRAILYRFIFILLINSFDSLLSVDDSFDELQFSPFFLHSLSSTVIRSPLSSPSLLPLSLIHI